MNKKIRSAALSLLFLLHGSYAVAGINSSRLRDSITDEAENADQKKKIEVFNFGKLPIDLQGYITTFMAATEDSVDQFKQKLLHWQYTRRADECLLSTQSTLAERMRYGFSGYKTPIHFYTYKKNKPAIIEVGCILENASKSINGRLWYGGMGTRIFLNNSKEQKLYQTDINHNNSSLTKSITPDIAIYACSFSVHGDVAIAWEDRSMTDQHGLYVTFAHIDHIKKGEPIDLNNGKIALHDIEKKLVGNGSANTIKGMLFNLQGTKLATMWHDIAFDPLNDFVASRKGAFPSMEAMQKRKIDMTGIQLIDAPSKDTVMAPNTILKRLMIAQKCIVKK